MLSHHAFLCFCGITSKNLNGEKVYAFGWIKYSKSKKNKKQWDEEKITGMTWENKWVWKGKNNLKSLGSISCGCPRHQNEKYSMSQSWVFPKSH